jgi:hypothetical protein
VELVEGMLRFTAGLCGLIAAAMLWLLALWLFFGAVFSWDLTSTQYSF